MMEMIASLITLLIFLGAVIAPFIFLLYKQKEDRAERSKREAEIRRQEGEIEEIDLSAGSEYSEMHGKREVPGGPQRRRAPETSRRGGTFTEGKESKEGEDLISHIADFKSEGLSHDLETRYDKWDEVGTQADSTHERGGGTRWEQQAYSSNSWAPSQTVSRNQREPSWLLLLDHLSPRRRAVVMAEILGPPKSLKDERDW